MKHIKKYRIFEKLEELPTSMLHDIEDIFLELRDDGFDINVHFVTYYKSNKSVSAIAIDIYDDDVYTYETISETILRLEEWSKINKMQLVVETIDDNNFHSLEDYIDIYGGEEIHSITFMVHK